MNMVMKVGMNRSMVNQSSPGPFHSYKIMFFSRIESLLHGKLHKKNTKERE